MGLLLVGGGCTNCDGGWFSRKASVELFPPSCTIPSLPVGTTDLVTFRRPSGQIVSCGGANKGCHTGGCASSSATTHCWVLNVGGGRWESGVVADLNMPRYRAAVVSLPVGTYVLGGSGGDSTGTVQASGVTGRTGEFLPAGATSWKLGPELPAEWGDFCAVAISATQFLAIVNVKIWEFDLGQTSGDPTSTNGWLGEDTWPLTLRRSRYAAGCGLVGNKLVVAGGSHISTEIIDLDAKTARQGPDMLGFRKWFQLLPVVGSDSDTILLALGGYQAGPGVPAVSLKAVEEWDPVSETWSEAEQQLVEGRIRYGAVIVDAALVCA